MIVVFFALALLQVQAQSPMKYLALGDSYTIGESVAMQDRWPNQLAAQLSKRGISIDKPSIIATTGWRTDNLANAITIAKPKEEFDLVSLLIGVNNQYQNRSIEQFKIEFEELLKTSIRLAKGKKENVFVVSIPDYGYTPFGEKNKEKISAAIDQFNNESKVICENNGVKYIFIADISREGLNDPTLVAPDGLHPSGKMYAMWVDRILKEVKLP